MNVRLLAGLFAIAIALYKGQELLMASVQELNESVAELQAAVTAIEEKVTSGINPTDLDPVLTGVREATTRLQAVAQT